MIASITPTQIKYVLALSEEGSFSKAAEKCFVTQSTLSTMVRKMESQLELNLFDRKQKPIKLTVEGQLLVDQLKTIYHEYENLEELIQETKKEFYGTCKIGIIPTVAPFLLPLFLDKMIKAYPNIHFSINEITTNEIASRIKSRELDVGILSLPLGDKELTEKSLYFEEFLVYDTSTQRSRNKKYKVKEIDVNRLLLLEESHCMANQIEKICHLRANRKITNNLVYNSGSILSLLELVNVNKGITLLPRLATIRKSFVDEKYLHAMESPIPVREVGFIMHSNVSKKRIIKVLQNEILEAVKPILNGKKKIKIIKPF